MKENLKIINLMEKAFFIIKLGINMKETGNWVLKKEKEYFIILMVKGLKENLKMMQDKVLEFTTLDKEIDLIFKNGEKYVGEINVKNYKFEGEGTLYYKNDNKYEGQWKNGRRDGKGTFYYNNGDKEFGEYKNDIKIGRHIVTDINGNETYRVYETRTEN